MQGNGASEIPRGLSRILSRLPRIQSIKNRPKYQGGLTMSRPLRYAREKDRLHNQLDKVGLICLGWGGPLAVFRPLTT